jgi:hypothetical protein
MERLRPYENCKLILKIAVNVTSRGEHICLLLLMAVEVAENSAYIQACVAVLGWKPGLGVNINGINTSNMLIKKGCQYFDLEMRCLSNLKSNDTWLHVSIVNLLRWLLRSFKS